MLTAGVRMAWDIWKRVLPIGVKKPLISVIVACYNQERFVAEAIDGILAQTYRPLEIVIVDDCSTDRTAEVIRAELAKRPDRSDVRFVHNQVNMTARGVCKLGFSMTKGNFVMIGCGDDIWRPEMITEFAKVWMEEDVSYVVANASYIDENSISLNRTFHDPAVPADDSFETLARDGGNACCFGPAVGLERELYTTFGWPPAYLGAVDIMLPFYAYLLKGARFIDKPLLKYRVHTGNTSLSLTAEQAAGVERLTVLERIYFGHLAHALFMQEELGRVSAQMPKRYAELERKISPLLTIQTVEMAKKLVRTRVALEQIPRSD